MGEGKGYLSPMSDMVHPGVRSALTTISALKWSNDDIKRIESLPRLKDYGFHSTVNTLLQL